MDGIGKLAEYIRTGLNWEEAKQNIVNHFKIKKESRAQIIHACGTGKTLTAYYVFKELKPNLTLFIVPSLQLVNQTLTEWCKESLADKKSISPFVVCSDITNEKIEELLLYHFCVPLKFG